MYKWKKDIAAWGVKNTLYMSIPFTWLLPRAEDTANYHRKKGKKVVVGGPATQLVDIDWAEVRTECKYDVLSLHNPFATFTTRGCPNHCGFCAVPKIEGEFRELKTWKPAPLVCDNNLLAASRAHFERVIDSLVSFPFVDFNQGLDARLMRSWHADQIARLKAVKVRFSFDYLDMAGYVADAIRKCLVKGLKDIGVYALIGYKEPPREAIKRLELIRSWDIRPNPMRYQPLDAEWKNGYVAPGWTEDELKKVMRYYSRLRYLEHIPFEDYQYGADYSDQLELGNETP
jgi:hypothetical protein